MRRIAANYLFPITSKPLKNGILELDDAGKITDIINTKGELKESAKLEFYNGILVPGFVNAHCHLELSHLKGRIPEKTGLPQFIAAVQGMRKTNRLDQQKSMQNAVLEMQQNGIVAVGDISNTDLSFSLKNESALTCHTFLEVYGNDDDAADDIMDRAEKSLSALKGKSSIVPHAPYSVSKKLLKKITDRAYIKDDIISMHNQETPSENQLFVEGRGELKESLEKFGVDFSKWSPTGFNSMQSTLIHLHKCNKIMLVHNTYTSAKDVEWLLNYFYPPENKTYQKHKIHLLYFTLCPNANLYIENRLPDIPMFDEKGIKICLGTDSLASNHQLSVLAEIKTIQQHFPEIGLEKLLKWATINGAEALELHKQHGSFEVGKTPGINLIKHVDFQQMKLTQNSTVNRII